MNGFGLLVLLTLQSQIGSQPALNTQNLDFGWQIAKGGVLEYIVQVSPDEAATMQANGFENASDIPPDLRGRIGRIVFRIGTTNLPQTPSIDAIRRIPRYTEQADLTDAIGRGSFADVEDDSIMNVNQPQLGGGLPPFNPSDNPGAASSPNPIDRASAIARESARGNSPIGNDPGNQFLGDAGGARSRTGSSFSDNPLPSANRQTPGNIPGTTKFDSTGRDTVAGGQRPGVGNWEAQNRLEADRLQAKRLEDQRLDAERRAAEQRVADARGGAGNGTGGGYDSNNYPRDGLATKYRDREAPSLDMDNFAALPSRSSLGQRTPVPGFGSTPGSTTRDDDFRNANDGRGIDNGNMAGARNGYGGGGYSGGGFGGGGGYGGGSYGGDTGLNGAPNRNNNLLAGGQGGQYAGPIRNNQLNGRGGQIAGNQNDNGLGSQDSASIFQAGMLAGKMSALQSGMGANGMPVDPLSRVASNTGPSTNPNQGVSKEEASPGDRDPQDKSQAGAVSDGSATGGNVFAQMFLVVSLVANVYLVYVLRRLLTKHRSVLTKLRSQTA